VISSLRTCVSRKFVINFRFLQKPRRIRTDLPFNIISAPSVAMDENVCNYISVSSKFQSIFLLICQFDDFFSKTYQIWLAVRGLECKLYLEWGKTSKTTSHKSQNFFIFVFIYQSERGLTQWSFQKICLM